jgi:hypothetical protein
MVSRFRDAGVTRGHQHQVFGQTRRTSLKLKASIAKDDVDGYINDAGSWRWKHGV